MTAGIVNGEQLALRSVVQLLRECGPNLLGNVQPSSGATSAADWRGSEAIGAGALRLARSGLEARD